MYRGKEYSHFQATADRDALYGPCLVLPSCGTRAVRPGNHKSPICSSKNLTDINFNDGAEFILSNLTLFSFFSGTHNEKSIYKIIDIMDSKKIDNNDSKIWFGQLYGMSDNISFKLSDEGYNVAKYVPYGPLEQVMPYLFRRAEENTSVQGQSSRELMLIKKEIKRIYY